jgi:hypothetical protein
MGHLRATSDNETGKIGPVPKVAAKTKPYFVVSLDLGTTKASGLRLVWLGFHSQRCSP